MKIEIVEHEALRGFGFTIGVIGGIMFISTLLACVKVMIEVL